MATAIISRPVCGRCCFRFARVPVPGRAGAAPFLAPPVFDLRGSRIQRCTERNEARTLAWVQR